LKELAVVRTPCHKHFLRCRFISGKWRGNSFDPDILSISFCTRCSDQFRQITFSVSTKNLAQPLAGKIGIITPTKAQITCLKAALTQWLLYWTECSIDDIIIGTQDDFVG
jgi:hypothetical protein